MAYFERISKYEPEEVSLPVRKTRLSAGYDIAAAEDCVIPSYNSLMETLKTTSQPHTITNLEAVAALTKLLKAKPTLVPTGIKCHLEDDEYLELSVRSSTPLKYWIILANGVGIIDADYWNNSDNEGHIYFQLINLSPFDIKINKGEILGQGIIKKYIKTDDDQADAERTGGFGSTSK